VATLFWLEEPQTVSIVQCPWYGPEIIFRLTHAGLPEKKVFGPARSLTLHDAVSGAEKPPSVADGVLSETSVRWVLHLSRLP
jgi:hypothetical protein